MSTCSISGVVGDVIAQCNILNGSAGYHYTMMLIDDEGSMLGSASGYVPENISCRNTSNF